MKISNITNVENPNFIIVRNYENSVVNFPTNFKIKEENAIGCWRVRIIDKIPKEYKQLNNTIWLVAQKKE
jgi:hypothetical protein